MTPARRLDVDGLVDARDLGGLPRRGGGLTPTGVFIRSERPDQVTAEGWRTLRERGLGTVLDLRQPAERAAVRSALPPDIADLHVDHDGLDDRPSFWAHFWDIGLVGTPLYYGPHLAALPERTTSALAAIATAPPGTVLFHCAGGRDRTGLVAAILLTIADVEEDAIVADYLQSIANAESLAIMQGRSSDESTVAALLATHGTTSERAFRTFLAGLDTAALLAALPTDEARALRTWRNAIPD